MAYRSLKECVLDLERSKQLLIIKESVDPNLVMAEIHRQIQAEGGPAILFSNVMGSEFPAVSNLFGTFERTKFILGKSFERVKKLVELRADPSQIFKNPAKALSAPLTAFHSLPKKVYWGPVLERKIKIQDLPQIKCWPKDGGAFITLPQVYSEDPVQPGWMKSNIGMYRIQLGGNSYALNQQVGMHYQIHRGIGVHHAKAIKNNQKLRVSIFVGGPPALTLGAVMPLPEGLSELSFMGMLSGRRFRHVMKDERRIAADADFCIVGTVDPFKTLPEGPFGDHLGYYSLQHDFPVLEVEQVYCRKDAIWPFTVVGRPPQEDSVFGKIIHELTGPMVPASIPGVVKMEAVDEAGVHPLLLAVGSERYVPYGERAPQEILTQANAILGFGQASLAKYLIIAANEDGNVAPLSKEEFFEHVLERVDWKRDLHFQTRTTIDTLDYSGEGLNQGSKVVIACAGGRKRSLSTNISQVNWPKAAKKVKCIAKGIVALEVEAFSGYQNIQAIVDQISEQVVQSFPLIVLCDDAEFLSASFANFLWATFTRSNPSHDIHGVKSVVTHKHWGCEGPLVIDARKKPHHAPELEIDESIVRKAREIIARSR